MKRCPQCQSVYEDAKNFCLNDGTPLVADPTEARPATPTPAAPETSPFPPPQPTQSVGGSQAGSWQSQQQQPVSSLSQPQASKRRVWPWVLGVVGVLVVGAVALLGVIGYVSYRAFKEAERRAPTAGSTGTTTRRADPDAAKSDSATADSSDAERKAEAAAEAAMRGVLGGGDADAPTDRDEVLEQLKEIEEEWARANNEGDKEAVARILAEEYVGTSHGGKTKRKAEYIRDLKPSTEIVSPQEFEDLRLVLAGGRAILTGVTVVEFKGDRTGRYRFVDIFVWRDGRWQAVTSTTTEIQ